MDRLIICTLIGSVLAGVATHKYYSDKILLQEMAAQAVYREYNLKVKRLNEEHREVLNESNEEYEARVAAAADELKSTRVYLNKVLNERMSRASKATTESGELCYTREQFDAAVRRYNDRLLGLIEQCSADRDRLNNIKGYYDNIQ